MRLSWIVLLAFVSCPMAKEEANAVSTRTVELIQDPHFERGFMVYDPKPGKQVVRGTLQWDASKGEPVWGLAQWSSKHSIAAAKAERLASRGIRFANAAKTLIVGPAGCDDADLVLGVDSRAEWGEHAREKDERWPHLLVQQRIPECPPLTELAALEFRVAARLRLCERFEPVGYNPRLHAAHYLIHFTVQNLNRESPGFGDFLWFGIPIYDDRRPIPSRHVAGDAASGKMIYDPGGDAYTSQTLQGGQWVTIERDILPLVLDGLRAAWERGFLKGSRDMADYRLGGVNSGWEVSGINRAEVQIRDLSLRAMIE